MKKQIFLLSLIFFGLSFRSDSTTLTDSLQKVLEHTAEDSSRDKILNTLVWEYINSDAAKAKALAQQELDLDNKINYRKGIFDAWTALGSISYMQSDFGNALSCHRHALETAEQMQYKRGIMIANGNLGVVYKDLGNHVLELEYCYKALKAGEENKDTLRLGALYSNLALALGTQKSFGPAQENILKALSIRERLHDQRGIGSCYLNIAYIYGEEKRFGDAITYLKKGENLFLELKDNYQLAKCYSNMGLNYLSLGDYVSARTYLDKSLEANRKYGNNANLAAACINLGTLLNKQKKSDEALVYLQQALEIAQKIGHKKWEMEAYAGMSNSYEDKGDYRKAFVSLNQYAQLRDTLAGEENSKQIAAMQVLYDTEKKEGEIKDLKQQKLLRTAQLNEAKLSAQKKNYLLGASLVFILSLLAAAYFYYTRQQLRVQQVQERAIRDTEENERVRMAKDIHDDLGSGLSKIKFITELMSGKYKSDPGLNTHIRSISDTSTELVDSMRDLIWALSPENTNLESLVARMREYASDYLSDSTIELRLTFPEYIPEMKVSKEAHRNLYFILKESLQNIVKHANASVVFIKLELNDLTLSLQISDNGAGFLPELVKSGNGLKNIRSRVAVIGGSVTQQAAPGKGTEIDIQVSLTNISRV
jgi:signal transduction histidine kinase